jgi:hypothetical protein
MGGALGCRIQQLSTHADEDGPVIEGATGRI